MHDLESFNAYIETYSGHEFRLNEPVFDIEDISHSLSQLCRFNGHTKKFYSVAEHCVMVGELMEFWGDNPLAGLVHDFGEAYLSDVPAPFKRALPDWHKAELKLEDEVFKWAKVGDYHQPNLKHADRVALFIEAKDLCASGGNLFKDPYGIRGLAMDYHKNREFRVRCWKPRQARRELLRAWNHWHEKA